MVHGAHGEVMVHVITSAEAVYKNVSDIVIILHQLMVVKDVLDTAKWLRRAILINAQVSTIFRASR